MLVIQFHTSRVWKMPVIQFSYSIEKWLKKILTKICCSLILIKQSDDKKTEVFVFRKKACHKIPLYGNSMTSIFFDSDTKVFPSNCEILFLFFINRKSNFACKNNSLHAQRGPGYKNVGNFFSMAQLCMLWSMSGTLKIQILKIIIVEKFCLKFTSSLLSLYHLWKTALSRFLCIINASPVQVLKLWVN